MKVINRTNNKILIEHNNFRVLITQEMLNHYENGLYTPDELVNAGVPVSIRWSDFISLDVTPEKIESIFYQHGIHTLDDLLKKSQQVTGAILTAVGLTSGSIYKSVENNKKLGGLNG